MNAKEKISQYATLGELTKSATALRLGIVNEPNFEQKDNLKEVCTHVFDKCREFVGGPLGINSGFRSPKLNAKIGGSPTSQHMKGEALDIDCATFGNGTNAELFKFIKDNLEFDQLIWEFGNDKQPDWLHVSYNRLHNRKQILRATKQGGRTIYLKQ
jgi:zinc D-Ala-D-Ala carboxypeptidase